MTDPFASTSMLSRGFLFALFFLLNAQSGRGAPTTSSASHSLANGAVNPKSNVDQSLDYKSHGVGYLGCRSPHRFGKRSPFGGESLPNTIVQLAEKSKDAKVISHVKDDSIPQSGDLVHETGHSLDTLQAIREEASPSIPAHNTEQKKSKNLGGQGGPSHGRQFSTTEEEKEKDINEEGVKKASDRDSVGEQDKVKDGASPEPSLDAERDKKGSKATVAKPGQNAEQVNPGSSAPQGGTEEDNDSHDDFEDALAWDDQSSQPFSNSDSGASVPSSHYPGPRSFASNVDTDLHAPSSSSRVQEEDSGFSYSPERTPKTKPPQSSAVFDPHQRAEQDDTGSTGAHDNKILPEQPFQPKKGQDPGGQAIVVKPGQNAEQGKPGGSAARQGGKSPEREFFGTQKEEKKDRDPEGRKTVMDLDSDGEEDEGRTELSLGTGPYEPRSVDAHDDKTRSGQPLQGERDQVLRGNRDRNPEQESFFKRKLKALIGSLRRFWVFMKDKTMNAHDKFKAWVAKKV